PAAGIAVEILGEVLAPLFGSRGRLQADQIAKLPQSVDQGPIDGRRAPRAVVTAAAARLAHLGRPELFARFPVQRENVARSLFAAHVAHREDTRADYRHAGKAAADGFGLPNQRWTVFGPVLQEIRIARNAVAIWTTKPGPVGLRVRLTGRQRKGIESSREDKA